MTFGRGGGGVGGEIITFFARVRVAFQSVVEVVLGAVDAGVRPGETVHFAPVVEALCHGKDCY